MSESLNIFIAVVLVVFISYLVHSRTLQNTYTLEESCKDGTISITLTPRDSSSPAQSIHYETTSECEN